MGPQCGNLGDLEVAVVLEVHPLVEVEAGDHDEGDQIDHYFGKYFPTI